MFMMRRRLHKRIEQQFYILEWALKFDEEDEE